MIHIIHDAYYDEGPILVDGPETDEFTLRKMYTDYWRNHPYIKWHDEFWPTRLAWVENQVMQNLQDPEHKAYTKFYNDYIEKNPCPPKHCIEDFVATTLVPLGFKVIESRDICV